MDKLDEYIETVENNVTDAEILFEYTEYLSNTGSYYEDIPLNYIQLLDRLEQDSIEEIISQVCNCDINLNSTDAEYKMYKFDAYGNPYSVDKTDVLVEALEDKEFIQYAFDNNVFKYDEVDSEDFK